MLGVLIFTCVERERERGILSYVHPSEFFFFFFLGLSTSLQFHLYTWRIHIDEEDKKENIRESIGHKICLEGQYILSTLLYEENSGLNSSPVLVTYTYQIKK